MASTKETIRAWFHGIAPAETPRQKRGDDLAVHGAGIIGANGESIPYGKAYSVAHRLTENTGRHGKRNSWWLRSWRVVKRALKTPLYPNTTTKKMRHGLIARLILYGIIFVVSLSGAEGAGTRIERWEVLPGLLGDGPTMIDAGRLTIRMACPTLTLIATVSLRPLDGSSSASG